MNRIGKAHRKRLFVDSEVQGAVIKRVLIYWAFCLLFITVSIAIGQTLADPSRYVFRRLGDTWRQHWQVLAAMVAMLPFVLYDMLKLRNRFAGPIFRLRRELKHFLESNEYQPIQFRQNDFWSDLADRVNDLVHRVEMAEQGNSGAPAVGERRLEEIAESRHPDY